MTPEHTLRLECLKLAMAQAAGLPRQLQPEPDQIVGAAATFAAFVTGGVKAPPEPVEPGSMAEAIEALRREVPGMVRDAMGAAYDP